MWLSVDQCNKPVLHDAGPDVCTIDSPYLQQKPCGRHWYWSDTGCCLLPVLPSHHQPHYLIGTLNHALHWLHLHLSFHLQSWKNNYNVTWTNSFHVFFYKIQIYGIIILWMTVTKVMVHTNSLYKETLYGNFHECKTKHDDADSSMNIPWDKKFIRGL
jgi:hypothetical protein